MLNLETRLLKTDDKGQFDELSFQWMDFYHIYQDILAALYIEFSMIKCLGRNSRTDEMCIRVNLLEEIYPRSTLMPRALNTVNSQNTYGW